jgi:predicted dehydrogenase
VGDALKAAFVGLRHMHIFDVYAYMLERQEVEIVAVCEEDPQTRERLASVGTINTTHSNFQDMLSQVQFDLLVVGDVFAKRGGQIIAALQAGKHVLSDKPLCTDLDELERIESLAEQHCLAVGAVLELRDSGTFRSTRELIKAGTIGEVHTIFFSGQHPVLLGSRPAWYFEAGNHGGTLNDLAIHGIDILQRITGKRFREIVAARCWNAGLRRHPQFRNAGQLMMVMEGGCGVLGDVSYISPDGFRYALPQYWRFTFWGERGMLEMGLNEPKIRIYSASAEQPELFEPAPDRVGGYLDDLLDAVRGQRDLYDPQLVSATRICLKVQEAADRKMTAISLSL